MVDVISLYQRMYERLAKSQKKRILSLDTSMHEEASKILDALGAQGEDSKISFDDLKIMLANSLFCWIVSHPGFRFVYEKHLETIDREMFTTDRNLLNFIEALMETVWLEKAKKYKGARRLRALSASGDLSNFERKELFKSGGMTFISMGPKKKDDLD